MVLTFLNNKMNYSCHIILLQQSLKHGAILKKYTG